MIKIIAGLPAVTVAMRMGETAESSFLQLQVASTVRQSLSPVKEERSSTDSFDNLIDSPTAPPRSSTEFVSMEMYSTQVHISIVQHSSVN